MSYLKYIFIHEWGYFVWPLLFSAAGYWIWVAIRHILKKRVDNKGNNKNKENKDETLST